MCDQCEYSSVIQRHHIYAKIFAPLERYSRAEANPTMILLSLAWPEPSSCRSIIAKRPEGAYTASDKLPARILRSGYARLSFAVYNYSLDNHFSTLRFVFEEKRHNIVCCNWPSSVRVYRKLRGYLISWFNNIHEILKIFNPRN